MASLAWGAHDGRSHPPADAGPQNRPGAGAKQHWWAPWSVFQTPRAAVRGAEPQMARLDLSRLGRQLCRATPQPRDSKYRIVRADSWFAAVRALPVGWSPPEAPPAPVRRDRNSFGPRSVSVAVLSFLKTITSSYPRKVGAPSLAKNFPTFLDDRRPPILRRKAKDRPSSPPQVRRPPRLRPCATRRGALPPFLEAPCALARAQCPLMCR